MWKTKVSLAVNKEHLLVVTYLFFHYVLSGAEVIKITYIKYEALWESFPGRDGSGVVLITLTV